MPTMTNLLDGKNGTVAVDEHVFSVGPDAGTSGFGTVDVTGFGFAPGTVTVKVLFTADPMIFAPTTEEHHTLAGLLAELGKLGSSRAIADFFYDEGVRGVRLQRDSCPVQKWLRIRTGRAYRVGSVVVRNLDGAIAAWLPDPVVRFIADFDMGAHRRLELPKGR